MEHCNQRILTTAQIAEFYGTDERRVSENFNRNKEHYTEGKHFYCLEGEALKTFGDYYANCVSVERVPKLYLWTEKGALMHAKSLNTDKAWQAYEMLVDDYYRLKAAPQIDIDQIIDMEKIDEALAKLRQVRRVVRSLQRRTDRVTSSTPRLLVSPEEERELILQYVEQLEEPTRRNLGRYLKRFTVSEIRRITNELVEQGLLIECPMGKTIWYKVAPKQIAG